MGYVDRIERTIVDLERSDKPVGFLLLGGVHHGLHLVPAAAALANAGSNVVLYVTSLEEEIWCRDLLSKLGTPHLPVVPLLPPRWARLAGKLNPGWAKPKAAILLSNRKRFNSLQALVVAERTSTLLKRFPGRKPFMIHIPHGAGDRAKGFEKRIRLFDHTIVAGNKDKHRMMSAGLVSDQNCSISGYIKVAAVEKIKPAIPHLFDNARPTILYNPHFDPKLSSWWKYGKEIISHFQQHNRYNLIFAPHVKIWNRINHDDSLFLEKAKRFKNIMVDRNSNNLIDMTYTRYSDIYLGDVSSQVYEFIVNPRPCVFILPDHVDYERNQDYAHCRFGDVCFTLTDLFAALEASERRHAIFKDVQRKGAAEAFGDMLGTGIDRAAAIITRVLANNKATPH